MREVLEGGGTTNTLRDVIPEDYDVRWLPNGQEYFVHRVTGAVRYEPPESTNEQQQKLAVKRVAQDMVRSVEGAAVAAVVVRRQLERTSAVTLQCAFRQQQARRCRFVRLRRKVLLRKFAGAVVVSHYNAVLRTLRRRFDWWYHCYRLRKDFLATLNNCVVRRNAAKTIETALLRSLLHTVVRTRFNWCWCFATAATEKRRTSAVTLQCAIRRVWLQRRILLLKLRRRTSARKLQRAIRLWLQNLKARRGLIGLCFLCLVVYLVVSYLSAPAAPDESGLTIQESPNKIDL